MLKLEVDFFVVVGLDQPPSGGCVLKRSCIAPSTRQTNQPPSGGCVLKPSDFGKNHALRLQPPSGGCVLKQIRLHDMDHIAAASRLRAAVC